MADTKDLSGTKVGEYEILARVGIGGMGVVYEGRQPLIGKRVAVKVLLPHLSNEQELVDRFLAEARAVNEIRHRGIVDIFSFGQLPDGAHYFVMEFLEGEAFDRILKRGPMPIGEALQWLEEILDALDAAHSSGIIHRDIKPSNLFLVATRRGRPYVKLLDFGIAKLGAAEGQSTPQTRASVIIGTPDYLAPEQARGKMIGPQTDLYSLGVVMFEMVTGRRPYVGPNALATMWMHVEGKAPRASSVNPSVPPEIDELILWAMSKEAVDRPKNAAEMREHVVALRATLLGAAPVMSNSGPVATLTGATPAPVSSKGVPVSKTPAPLQPRPSKPSKVVSLGDDDVEPNARTVAEIDSKKLLEQGLAARASASKGRTRTQEKSATVGPTIDNLRKETDEELEAVKPPQRSSMVPLMVGAAVLLIGIAIAAVYVRSQTSSVEQPKDEPTPIVKPVDTKPVDTKPVDTKPVDTKPVDTKPVDTKPVDTKPVDTKPVDTKPVGTKPVDTKPVGTKPVDVKPADTKPVIPKPVDVKPTVRPVERPAARGITQAQLDARLVRLQQALAKHETEIGGPDRVIRQFMTQAVAQVKSCSTDAQRKEAWAFLDDISAQLGTK